MQSREASRPLAPEQPGSTKAASIAGFGILAFALIVFLLGLCVQPSPIVDFFWQARTGRWIVDHHAVPHGDLYSWTRHGHPWIVHEWAMCVLLWDVYTAGGYSAVWVLMLGLVAATFLALFVKVRRETGGATLTAFALTLWAAKLSSPLIAPRPHLISYLCLVALLWIVLDARRGDAAKRRRLWLLPPLCALWANFHGAVVVGVGIAAAFALLDAADALWIKTALPERRARMLQFARLSAVVVPISAAATLLNPYGWRLFTIFAQTVGDKTMPSFVSEWSALDFHSALALVFEVMLVIFVLGMAMSRERRDLSEILVLIILMHAALTASRNAPIFGIAGVMIAARHIQSALAGALKIDGENARRTPSLFGPSPPVGIAAIVALAVCLQSAMLAKDAVTQAPAGDDVGLTKIARVAFAMDSFPQSACAFLRRERFPTEAKLYNSYDWGSYILWTTPEYPVFISTQTDVFFGDVLTDYTRLSDLPVQWRSVLGTYNPDIVFLSAVDRQRWMFMTDPDWSLVYADNADLDSGGRVNAVIFVRRLPRYRELIARCRRDCAALRTHPELANEAVIAH